VAERERERERDQTTIILYTYDEWVEEVVLSKN
jgi:hypothetical protein